MIDLLEVKRNKFPFILFRYIVHDLESNDCFITKLIPYNLSKNLF